MCYMFIKQTDPNISSLLVMPKYLWPYACFAYSKSLEIKICGLSQWSPGRDCKAATFGEDWKEDQLVGGYYNYFFPYSFFTALGSRHRRNNSLNFFLLFCTPDPPVFDRSESPTSHRHSFSDFSVLKSIELQLAEPMLTTHVSFRACMSRYRGSPYSHSATVSSSWSQAYHE